MSAVQTTEELRKNLKPLKVFDLGTGLEVWLVNIAVLKEQDVNARAMAPDAFLQLTANIGKRGALESLPLCALTEKGLEIVSGHHRIRAARKAGLKEAWVLVDVTNMSRDHLKAKQLAHNSLQGKDNEELVKQIFESIQIADAKIEAFIDPKFMEKDLKVQLSTADLKVEFDTKIASIIFLPLQFKVFKDALERLKVVEPSEVFLAAKDEYDTLVAAMDKAAHAFNITSTPTLLTKMAEIVLANMPKPEQPSDGADQK